MFRFSHCRMWLSSSNLHSQGCLGGNSTVYLTWNEFTWLTEMHASRVRTGNILDEFKVANYWIGSLGSYTFQWCNPFPPRQRHSGGEHPCSCSWHILVLPEVSVSQSRNLQLELHKFWDSGPNCRTDCIGRCAQDVRRWEEVEEGEVYCNNHRPTEWRDTAEKECFKYEENI